MKVNKDRNKPRKCVVASLTLEQVSILTGADPGTVEFLVSLELISPSRRRPRPVFPTDAVPRLRRMLRLHHDLGVSWSNMDLVMDLLDRIDALERRI